jgi:hypothetical protein
LKAALALFTFGALQTLLASFAFGASSTHFAR